MEVERLEVVLERVWDWVKRERDEGRKRSVLKSKNENV